MIDFAHGDDVVRDSTPVPTLALRDVTRRWRAGILGAQHEVTAIERASFDVHPGEIAVVSGGPASGKSTLLLVAAGRASPSEGTVSWDGASTPARVRAQLVGARPWEYGFLTVRQAIAFHADVLALEDDASPLPTRFVPLLLRVGLRGMAKVRIGQLSAIDQFRIVVAQALLSRPRLLCCDEPFAYCGPTQRAAGAALLRSLARSGLAIVVGTREPAALVAIGERVKLYALDRGRLRATPPPRHSVLELAVPQPEEAISRLLPRLPSLARRGRRIRVPLGGISPEAVLAVCRDVGVHVRASRVAEEPLPQPEPLP